MEVAKGVTLEYTQGEVVLKAKVKELVIGELAKVKAKFESGEIDLVKGTDLDKAAALGVISAIEMAL